MTAEDLGMKGPFNLTLNDVNGRVSDGVPGNYILVRAIQESTIIRYVGRSDDQLQSRLKTWANESNYDGFCFSYAKSKADAFHKECKLFHNLNGLDNKIHPDSPDGMNLACPYC